MTYWLHILASRRNGTLDVGVTNDLARRAWEHREGVVPAFTSRHGVTRLVHVEPFHDVHHALQREKNLKHWPRAWKLALVEKDNPTWRDLYDDLLR